MSPECPLVAQEGRTVGLWHGVFTSRGVSIDVDYTHRKCVCPLETARLTPVQRVPRRAHRVGRFLLLVNIDPARDMPDVLWAYAEQLGAGPGWLFLTETPDAVKLATRASSASSSSRTP